MYFFPEYIDLNIKDHKSEDGLMFFVKDEKNIWLNCFIKKKSKIVCFSDQLYFDLETPYDMVVLYPTLMMKNFKKSSRSLNGQQKTILFANL